MELHFKTGHCCACRQFKHSVHCTVAEKCQANEPISHYGKNMMLLVSSKVEMV